MASSVSDLPMAASPTVTAGFKCAPFIAAPKLVEHEGRAALTRGDHATLAELDEAVPLQLAQVIAGVGMRDRELPGDLGVGLAPPDGDGDLAFAFAELIQRGGGVPLPGGVMLPGLPLPLASASMLPRSPA